MTNRTHHLVISKKEWFAMNKVSTHCFMKQPPTALPATDLKDPIRHSFFGARIGKSKILGVLSMPTKKKRWVLQCDCGLFFVRLNAEILKDSEEGNNTLCCHVCREEKKSDPRAIFSELLDELKVALTGCDDEEIAYIVDLVRDVALEHGLEEALKSAKDYSAGGAS